MEVINILISFSSDYAKLKAEKCQSGAYVGRARGARAPSPRWGALGGGDRRWGAC